MLWSQFQLLLIRDQDCNVFASIDEFHDKNCCYVRQLFFSIRLTFFAFYVTRVMSVEQWKFLKAYYLGNVSFLILYLLQMIYHFAAIATLFKSSEPSYTKSVLQKNISSYMASKFLWLYWPFMIMNLTNKLTR